MNPEKKQLFRSSGLYDGHVEIKKLENTRIIEAVNSTPFEILQQLIVSDDYEGNLTLNILGNHNAVYAINHLGMEKLKLLFENPQIQSDIMKGLLSNRVMVDVIDSIDVEKLQLLIINNQPDSDRSGYSSDYDYSDHKKSEISFFSKIILIGNCDIVEVINSIDIEKLKLIFDSSSFWSSGTLLKALKQPEIVEAINSIDIEKLKLLSDSYLTLGEVLRQRELTNGINSLKTERFSFLLKAQNMKKMLMKSNVVNTLNSLDDERFQTLRKHISDLYRHKVLQNENSLSLLSSINIDKLKLLLINYHESRKYSMDNYNYKNNYGLNPEYENKGDIHNYLASIELLQNQQVIDAINSIDIEKLRMIRKSVFQNYMDLRIFEKENFVNAIKSINRGKLKRLVEEFSKYSQHFVKLLNNENNFRIINSLSVERFAFLLQIIRYDQLGIALKNKNFMEAFITIEYKKLELCFKDYYFSYFYDVRSFVSDCQGINALKSFDFSKIEILRTSRTDLLTAILKNENANKINSMDNERFSLLINSTTIYYMISYKLLTDPVIDGLKSMNLEKLKILLSGKIAYCKKSDREILIDCTGRIFGNPCVVDAINAMDIQRFKLLISKINGPVIAVKIEKLSEFPVKNDELWDSATWKTCVEALTRVLGNADTINIIESFVISKLKLILNCDTLQNLIMKGLFENQIAIDGINSMDLGTLKTIVSENSDPVGLITAFELQA